MKAFIENEAGSRFKNLFDEKRLELEKTIEVSRPYPFPYGFLLKTTAEDGDNVDVFVLTNKKLKSGELVEIEILGLMEQFEKSWDENSEKEEIDHNIIAKLKGDDSVGIDAKTMDQLRKFVLHVFDNIRINKTRVGEFRDKKAAMEYIGLCREY